MQSELIDSELDRIVKSKPFSSSPRLVRFLRYCVEHSQQGRQECLKETMIGVHVFDRVPCYDPKADPIVRVHARRLRQKLDAFYDSEQSPAVIIRIPKGGYVAQFEKQFRTAAAEPRGAEAAKPAAARFQLALAAVAILAVAAVAVVAGSLMNKRRDSVEASIQPLISLPGAAKDPAWSPDGKTVAFSWDSGTEGNPRIYLVKSGESVPARLTRSVQPAKSVQPEFRPVWSPDGQSIALLRESRPHTYSLVIAGTRSGSERHLRDIVQLSAVNMAPALDWSRDGRWLVTSEQPSGSASPTHLLLVSARDGRSWVISDPPDGSTGDLEAKFSPDGKRILFRRGGNGDLFMLPINGSEALQPLALTTNNPGVRGLAFAPGGRDIFFGSREDSSRFAIWRLPPNGEHPLRLTPPSMDVVEPAVDPSGRFLAFMQTAIDSNLWLYSLGNPENPRLLAPSTQNEYDPAFSPDGKTVAFISDRSGAPEIWIAGADGGQPRQLTSFRGASVLMWPSWSFDGGKLTYFCRSQGRNYAYQTAVRDGATQALAEGKTYSLFPQYSLDGKRIYYVSNVNGRFRIWTKPLVEGAASQLFLAEEIRQFRLSKDGSCLYFVRGSPGQLIRVELATRNEEPVWTFAEPLAAFDSWDVSGNRLYYIAAGTEHETLRLMTGDLTTGESRRLGFVRALSQDGQTSIAASPSGDSAVVSQIDSDNTRLMLMPLVR